MSILLPCWAGRTVPDIHLLKYYAELGTQTAKIACHNVLASDEPKSPRLFLLLSFFILRWFDYAKRFNWSIIIGHYLRNSGVVELGSDLQTTLSISEKLTAPSLVPPTKKVNGFTLFRRIVLCARFKSPVRRVCGLLGKLLLLYSLQCT